MPTYDYKCSECDHEMEVFQGFDEDFLTKCPECEKETLEQVISVPHFSVKGEPKILIQQAERNTKKMGKYELEERRLAAAEGTRGKKKEVQKSWWEKNATKSNKEVAKMSPKEKSTYIEKGK